MLVNGDCLQIMESIPSNSIDFVFADLPYGKTANKWDVTIPFDRLWTQLLRIGKPTTPYAFTACSGFEFQVYNSNPTMYKYKWVWNKNNSSGFALAKLRPFQTTEDVLVFGVHPVYHPIMEVRGNPRTKGGYNSSTNYGLTPIQSVNNVYYPKGLLNFTGAIQKNKLHPTQKPVELLTYLIQTYTQEGDIVLDPTMGVGTTGIASKSLNRDFIGIELDPTYFKIARSRIEET